MKNGKSAAGKQGYRCLNKECLQRTFIFSPSYPGRTNDASLLASRAGKLYEEVENLDILLSDLEGE